MDNDRCFWDNLKQNRPLHPIAEPIILKAAYGSLYELNPRISGIDQACAAALPPGGDMYFV